MDVQKPMRRWEKGHLPVETVDSLAIEEPLEIRVKSRSISVTMRTPGHDEELAVGFLRSEGLIHSSADLLGIEPCNNSQGGNLVIVSLAPNVPVDFAQLTRHVFASSSCGLCGKASIEAIRRQFSAITWDGKVTAEVLQHLPEKLRAAQSVFEKTGGLHAAAIFGPAGNLLVLREDIGRHNAVDKVLGWSLLSNTSLEDCILLVSGRASFEIMQKALSGRIPIVAAVSAPSSLAVDFAVENGQTLIGFLRPGRMNVYTHGQRVIFA